MPKYVYDTDSRLDVFTATIYAEARGEGTLGMQAVAHVMNNRADANKSYWGGSDVKNVCLKERQFECWDGVTKIRVDGEPDKFKEAKSIAQSVIDGTCSDPTGGCDHYNNPAKENADWVHNVKHIMTIGNHYFYKSK